MHSKIHFLLIFGIFAIGLLAMTISITITASATTQPLQAGDMSIVAAVTTDNISIYSTSSMNASYKIAAYTIPGSVQFVTGTNAKALAQYFVTQMYSDYVASFQSSSSILSSPIGQSFPNRMPVTIYSLSASGIKHLGVLPTLQTFLPKLLSLHPTFETSPTIGYKTSSTASSSSLVSLNSFAKILSINESDFNAVGQEGQDQESFKTGDVLSAGNRSYTLLNSVQMLQPINDTFMQYGINSGILNPDGTLVNRSIPTETIVGGTTTSTSYQVLYAGYNNFNKEAIVNPFINYFVALEAQNGTKVDPSTLTVKYTDVNRSMISQFESQKFKDTIMAPVVAKYSSSSSSPFGLKVVAKANINFFGVPIYTTSANSNYKELFLGTGTAWAGPLLNLNSFTAMSTATTTSVRNSVGNSMNLFSNVNDGTADGILDAMGMNNNMPFSDGSNFFGGSTNIDRTRLIRNAADPPQATSNGVNQVSAVKSNPNSLMTYLPFVLIGVGVLAVAAIFFLKSKRHVT